MIRGEVIQFYVAKLYSTCIVPFSSKKIRFVIFSPPSAGLAMGLQRILLDALQLHGFDTDVAMLYSIDYSSSALGCGVRCNMIKGYDNNTAGWS